MSRSSRALFDAAALVAAALVAACDRDVSLTRETGPSCDELPLLRSAARPAIDGELEPGLALTRLEPRGWNAAVPIPAGFAVRYAIAYHAEGLYAYFEVRDPTRNPAEDPTTLFCGDAVELFVDSDGHFPAAPAYDAPGAVQLIVSGPGPGESDVARGHRYRTYVRLEDAWTSPHYRAFARPGGWVAEMFVEPRDLDLDTWSLAPGDRIGLNVSVDVGGPEQQVTDFACPGRVGQFSLRTLELDAGACGVPYCHVGSFCTPRLAP